MASIPPKFLDHKNLAEDIYTCWRELMLTDKVDGVERWPTYKTLSDTWRKALIESVQMTVTAGLRKIQDMNDAENAVDFAFTGNEPEVLKQAGNSQQRACYVCQQPTISASRIAICSECRAWRVR